MISMSGWVILGITLLIHFTVTFAGLGSLLSKKRFTFNKPKGGGDSMNWE